MKNAPFLTTFLCICLVDCAAGQQFDYKYDSLRQVIQAYPDDSSAIDAYVKYASRFFYSKSDSAMYYLNRGCELAQQHKSDVRYAECLKNEGDFYSIDGDFKKAVGYYRQAIGVAERTRHPLLLMKIKSNLGIAYKNLGQMDSAIGTLSGVVVEWKPQVRVHEDSIALALLYIQLFDVYKVQGLMEDAIYYGEEGYRLSTGLAFSRGIGYGLYVEALKHSRDAPDLALDYCDRALAIAVSKEIAELEVFVRGLKADIYMDRKEYEAATHQLQQNLRYTAGSIVLVTNSRLSRLYYLQKDYKRSLSSYRKAIDLAYRLGYRAETAQILENGIALYRALGDYKTAFELLRKYDEVSRQIASEKLRLDYERASFRFRTAEKDKELALNRLLIEQKDDRLERQSMLILLLVVGGAAALIIGWILYRQQQKLQRQRIKTLEASRQVQMMEAAMTGEERERTRIAKDLHDGVGSLLSAIKMRFSLARDEFPELKNSPGFGKALVLLDETSVEIRKTAHNLLPDMLIRFGLFEATQTYVEKIRLEGGGRVDYQQIGDGGRFNKSLELMVYRIIQELVGNIVKHSQAKNAFVQLARQGELLMVSVEDDGIGFDKELLNGFRGSGLHSITDRVRSLGGEIEVDTTPGHGVSVFFELVTNNFNDHTYEDQTSHGR